MNRRDFVKNSASALVGAGLLSVAPLARAEEKTAKPKPSGPFWPDGARLVISVSMQFEAGAQPERGASGPFPPLDPQYADLPMQTWYKYGINEGIPRMLDLWDRRGIKVTSHMVGQAVERTPALAREIVERGHEAAAHGQTWEPQFSMTPDQERAAYVANIESIQKATGVRPIGFNAFWLRGTPNTLGILQDLGFLYHIDDVSRDEPYTVQVKGKPFVVVPYTLRNNDIVRFDSPATTNAGFLSDLKDDFDVLYEEAGSRRRMMSVSTHDRIGGTPGRVKALDEFIQYAQKQKGVVFMRKDDIARWTLTATDVPHEA